MSLVNKVGNFLFGSNIKPNTGDKHTDSVSHRVYEEGVFQLAQNNYKEALNKFKKASSLGHVSAKYNQALMLFNGLGDYPDFETAKKLFIEAKQAGHTRCDDFIHFMREVDEVMENGDPHMSSYRDIFGKNIQLSFTKIILDVKKQAGELIYLVSRDVIRKINCDYDLASEFISNELGAMHLGNEVSIQYLKYINKYDENFIWEDFENNFNQITRYLDYSIWPSVVKASNGILEIDDLVYARCCIVNEVIKAFPNYN